MRYVRATDVDAENPRARGLRAHAAVCVAVVATASARPGCTVDRGTIVVIPVPLTPMGIEDMMRVIVRALPLAGRCNRTPPP